MDEQFIHDAAVALVLIIIERLFWLHPEPYRQSLAEQLYPIVRAGIEGAIQKHSSVPCWKEMRFLKPCRN